MYRPGGGAQRVYRSATAAASSAASSSAGTRLAYLIGAATTVRAPIATFRSLTSQGRGPRDVAADEPNSTSRGAPEVSLQRVGTGTATGSQPGTTKQYPTRTFARQPPSTGAGSSASASVHPVMRIARSTPNRRRRSSTSAWLAGS